MDTDALKPVYNAAFENPIGPAFIEHRTAQSGLSQLGTYFMRFPEPGHSEPWTVRYEETIYVIEGRAELTVIGVDGQEHPLVADAGELIVLPRDTTVRYGATQGTRLLLSIAPVRWRDAL